jgi:carbonic anhydrase/acetyltransferase-like protein (isoleucine patch superfamily)
VEFELGGKRPSIHPDAYIAPTAVLIGDVDVGAGASVWFGAVLRGDEAQIRVGAGANIQDNAVIHCAQNLPTVIEADASVGHSAQLEGCVVEQGAVVGMGATMLQRSRLGRGSLLAAGSVLAEGSEVPPGYMAAGVPAKVKKPLDGSSENWVGMTAQHYRDRAVAYREKLRPIRS